MKKLISLIFLLFSIIITACDKVPINGALDGQWQLMEKIVNGDTTDLKGQHLYCAFQLELCMFGSKNVGIRNYFCYFDHSGSTLRFHTFTHRSAYTEENNVDKLITEDDLDKILPWGFYSADCTFDVKELSNSRMILTHDNTTIIYRKL